MAPLYDVMSIWPIVGKASNQYSLRKASLAMALSGQNRHYRFTDIQRRHFDATAARSFSRTDANDVIEQVLARMPGVIAAVASRLPSGFPEQVAETIFAGMQRLAMRLAGS